MNHDIINQGVIQMINLLNTKYTIVNGKENFILEEVEYLFTEYFLDYDYILGDYAYNKLRLKGFNESSKKNAKKINDIKYLDKYIKEYCAYGAKTFLLKKENI